MESPYTALTQFVVKHGNDPSAKIGDVINIPVNHFGDTILHSTVTSGDNKLLLYLLKIGANPNVVNNLGSSPLHIVSENGNELGAKALIQYGADINLTNREGQTPLHEAALFKKISIVKILVENGADISIRDRQGRTPLYVASSMNFKKGVDYLLEKGANPNISRFFADATTMQAAQYHLDIMKALLMHGFKLENENLNNYEDKGKKFIETILNINKLSAEELKRLFDDDYDFWMKMAMKHGKSRAYPIMFQYYQDLFPAEIPSDVLYEMAEMIFS